MTPVPGVTCQNKETKMQTSKFFFSESVELWYLVCSISLWTTTKFVHMMPLGSKLAPLIGSQDGTKEQIRPTSKFFLSETFWLVYLLEATFSVRLSWKLVRMFVLIKSQRSSKMVYVGSKTRSLVQVLGKPCVCSRGHIFSPIIMKLGQNVCIDNILDEFERGSFRVKN